LAARAEVLLVPCPEDGEVPPSSIDTVDEIRSDASRSVAIPSISERGWLGCSSCCEVVAYMCGLS
jgi:hypothetical protein